MSRGLDRSGFASSSRVGAEIVFGIVAPVGTDVDFVAKTMRERLEHFNYTLEEIRVSSLIREFTGLRTTLVEQPFYERVTSYMDGGNELRARHNRGDVLALSAIGSIRQLRAKRNPDNEGPAPRTAYFLRSLKHPDEVQTLREVYGRGFFLVGVSSPRETRLKVLTEHRDIHQEKAENLLKRDESEQAGHGQQTREAFHLADAFVALGNDDSENREQLWRLLDILFGQPFITPTKDEYAMFLAYAASVRSADLSRQVGAVITTDDGEVLSTGANDVPAPQGGSYWSNRYIDWPKGKPNDDHRDWVLGYDSNRKRRNEIAEEVGTRVRKSERTRIVAELKRHLATSADPEREALLATLTQAVTAPDTEADAVELLADTKLMDLTEFGRAVHAEMDALMACTRVGARAKGARLFCTTFPCHNCTKHIVSAGIREVVYIEPYPKSLAEELYPEAVESQSARASSAPPQPDHSRQEATSLRVVFRPFTGVGPRKYLDLFSLTLSTGRALSRKDAAPNRWSRNATSLRASMVPTSYLEREEAAFKLLNISTDGANHDHQEE